MILSKHSLIEWSDIRESKYLKPLFSLKTKREKKKELIRKPEIKCLLIHLF